MGKVWRVFACLGEGRNGVPVRMVSENDKVGVPLLQVRVIGPRTPQKLKEIEEIAQLDRIDVAELDLLIETKKKPVRRQLYGQVRAVLKEAKSFDAFTTEEARNEALEIVQPVVIARQNERADVVFEIAAMCTAAKLSISVSICAYRLHPAHHPCQTSGVGGA